MLLFVVPMIESMYADRGGTLPLPTQVLVTGSKILTSSWWLILLFIIGGTIGFRRWIATPPGRLIFDRFKLKLPVFGVLIRKSCIARFARTLASLVRSGVPIMESLDIVGGTA